MAVTTNDLIGNLVHIGRPTFKWNPKMKRYIAGETKQVHILDVYKVQDLLNAAVDFLRRSRKEGKSFLLVGTKFQVSDLVEQLGRDLRLSYVHHKWLSGLLTNFETVKKRIQTLRSIEEMQQTGEIEKYTKKERLRLQKERENLLLQLGGVRDMDRLPDVMIIFDVNKEHIALSEANKLGITVVGVMNTNANPDGVAYPIPANDTSRKSLQFLLGLIREALSTRPEQKAAPVAEVEEAAEAELPGQD